MEIKKFSSQHEDYLKDESRVTGTAEYICFPHSREDILEVLDFCRQRNIPMTIQGSRTGITAGAVPFNGLILNLEKMNRITGIRQDKEGFYYLRCQPGLKLEELRQQLRIKNYTTADWSKDEQELWKKFIRSGNWFFPPDPTETSASLGGMAACNASGARSFRYGATRNWITALKSVPIWETYPEIRKMQIKRLSQQMKNAAGYCLQPERRDFDLIIGSEGTLGIICELEIKLLPLPEKYMAVMQFFAAEEDALAFAEELKQLKPDAIEYFGNNALDILRVNKHLWQELPALQEHWKFGIYLEFSGNEEEKLEEKIFQTTDLAEKCHSTENDSWFVDTAKGIDEMKTFRHALPEAINLTLDEIKKKEKNIAKISTDLAVADGYLKQMVKLYREAENEGWQVIVFGHIGDNHLHTNILPHNVDEFKNGNKLAEKWAAKAVQAGGSVSAEHGIGKTKRHLLSLMYNQEEMNLFRKIKDIYDPFNILNRGNLFL